MVRTRHGSDDLTSAHAKGGFTQLYRRFPAFLLVFATGVSGLGGGGIRRGQASTSKVNGPSLTNSTSIIAPNSPVSTCNP